MMTLTQSLTQYPYLYNGIILFPLLGLGGLILFLLRRADTLRQGAGLVPEAEPVYDELADGEEEGEFEDDFDDDLQEFLNDQTPGDVEPLNDAGEGPANPHQMPVYRTPSNMSPRQIGKKKARSLEQRDRRRAYHEFLRNEQAERRAQDDSIEEEIDEKVYAEKQRRALVEIKIEEKRARERTEKAKVEEAERDAGRKLREIVVGMGSGKIHVKELGRKIGRGEEWVTSRLVEEKVLGSLGDFVVILTADGTVAKVGREELSYLSRDLESKGRLGWEEMSLILETQLKRRF